MLESFLVADRLHGLFFHFDDLRGIHHVNRQVARRRMARKFLAQQLFRTHQQHSHAIVARGQQCPFNLGPGMPV